MSMKRTTVMIPTDLRIRALQQAERLGISLGELIRNSLSSIIQRPTAAVKRDPLFSDKAIFRGQAPRDLAQHHDRYLYPDPEKRS